MPHKATDNLLCYLHEARLPDMHYSPAATSKMEPLVVRPQRYRRLEAVHAIDASNLGDMVFNWTEDRIPSTSLAVGDEDEETGERFTVPCEPRFSVPSLPLGRVDDIERVSLWIDNFPLESVRRAMHLLYPSSIPWRFSSCEESSSQTFFKRFSWSRPASHEGVSGKNKSVDHVLTVFAFAPWTLSEEDLRDLTLPQTFLQNRLQEASASTPELEHCPFKRQEELWSKLWDTCFSSNCQWFVVSTYTHWVLGVFSAGWTDVFVTSVYKHDRRNPTVLELLLFWVISAMGCEGGWVPPQFGSDVPSQLLCATVADMPVDDTKYLTIARYE